MVNRNDVRTLIAAFTILLIAYHQQHARRTALLTERHRRRRRTEVTYIPYCRLPSVNRDVSEILNGDQETTKRHIRMTAESFKAVCERLTPKSQGWSREFEVAVFLFWLAHGACYRVIGEMFSIPRSTSHMIVKGMLKEIKSIVSELIKFPSGRRLDVVGDGFAQTCGTTIFKKAVGALHSIHVCVMENPNLHSSYMNQKLFYSIQLQGLCDHEGYFINIFCGSPGSFPDARVLKQSAFYQQSMYPPPGYFIIGGNSYPNLESPIALVTPFKNEEELPKATFNQSLNKGLMMAERTLKMLKVRWMSTFRKALPVKMAVDVTVVCAVLHNICMSLGDVLPFNEYEVSSNKQSASLSNPGNLRDHLLSLHSSKKRVE